jgi:hypothetical protein
MRGVQTVRASARYGRAIDAVSDLLARLRIAFIFVGSVARSAWLGSRVEQGSVDLIAVMKPEQKNQVVMMGSNRGFRVDRAEVENSEELDLIPIHFVDADGGEVRIHILLATNALYGRMVAAAVQGTHGEQSVGLPALEDLAVLLAVADDAQSVRDREMLIRLPEFNRRVHNQRLISIGLPQLAVAE